MASKTRHVTAQEIAQAASSDAPLGIATDSHSPMELRLVLGARHDAADVAYSRNEALAPLASRFTEAAKSLPTEAQLADVIRRASVEFLQQRPTLALRLESARQRESLQSEGLRQFRVANSLGSREARYSTGSAVRPLVVGMVCETALNCGLMAPHLAHGLSEGVALACLVSAINMLLALAAALAARHTQDPTMGVRPRARLALKASVVVIATVNALYAWFREALVRGSTQHTMPFCPAWPLPFSFETFALFLLGCGAAAVVGLHRYRAADPIPGYSELDKSARGAVAVARAVQDEFTAARKSVHTAATGTIASALGSAEAALAVMRRAVEDMQEVEADALLQLGVVRDGLAERLGIYASIYATFKPLARFGAPLPAIEIVAPPITTAPFLRDLEDAERTLDALRAQFSKALAGLDGWLALEATK